jgi:hypothetical protein
VLRSSARAVWLTGAAVVLALGLAVGRGDATDDREPACSGMALKAGKGLIAAYRSSGTFTATQSNARGGGPSRVSVVIPRIDFTGPGSSGTLPVGPCQTIYRFVYRHVRAPDATPSPFRYVEVDWNTEGKQRGPHGSFVSPHFDFHFYLRSKRVVDTTTSCPSTDHRTCDALLTGYARMRRFLRLPPGVFVPHGYRPDPGSSIPRMGFHVLDGKVPYTQREVDHNATLFYGTFDGSVLFAEASVALATLQDAMHAPGHIASFRYRQPRVVRGGGSWPTRFTVRYSPGSGEFTAAFERFRTPAR